MMETVDPIEQLAMMLAWEEDYTDEYKRRFLIEAMRFVAERKDLYRTIDPSARD
jgi:hypothetical protein